MTHVIAEPCIGTEDASCVEVFPVDCFQPTLELSATPTSSLRKRRLLPVSTESTLLRSSDG